jgi:hypothetical protein
MPHIIGIWCELNVGYVADDPTDMLRHGSESLLSHVNRGLGNIEDREVVIAAGQEVVDERGFAAADVD